jgi:uncharacterized protein YukE
MSTQDSYENASLVEIHSMVANAKPEELSGKAEALQQAAAALEELGGHVAAKVQGVEWTGQGGDAFREWSDQFLNNTRQLRNYTQTVAHVMGYAGQTLHEVQPAVPTPPNSAYLGTPNTPTKLSPPAMESDRQEAITAINKLASTYRLATQDLTAAKQSAPTFQPLPGAILPPDPHIGEEQTQITASSTEEAAPARSDVVSDPSTGTPAGRAVPESASTAAAAGHSAERVSPTAPSTNLDSTAPATVAQRPHAAITTVTPSGPSSGRSPAPFVPDIVGVPTPLAKPNAGGRALATEPLPELGSGTGTPNRLPPTGVGDEGIIGGTPSASNRSLTPRMPRGLVVGEEQPPGMRGPAGGARYAGVPGPSSGVVGGVPARRLASEPGGEVSAPRSGTGSASEYTPGGSGLRRSPEVLTEEGVVSGSDVHPTGSVVGARPGTIHADRGRRGKRPDYLVEDEETWASGGRDVVPHVVD